MKKKVWKSGLPPFRKHKIKVFENAAKTGQFIYQIGELDALRKPSKEIPVNELVLSYGNKITSKSYQK